MLIFLFTDIEGSTNLWQKYPAEMNAILARHDDLLRGLVERFGGKVIKNTGDGLFAIFEKGDPLTCALELEKQLAREDWSPAEGLRVRVAMHCGEASERDGDYFGLDINRTMRLLTAGWGGQVLLTCELVRASAPPAGGRFEDQGIHVLKDLSEPQHIFTLEHPDLPLRTFPALRTLSAHAHNLPPQPTPFVGRGAELADITRQLQEPDCRLLTLAGSGGIGKTRLALQAGAGLVETFRHGVFFVSLAPLTTGEQIIPAIAEAIRFTFHPREDLKSQMANYLREKSLLLIMDNFEHLANHAGLVAELLAQAPGLKVMVTSRERLNLRDEQVYPVEGMRVPSKDETKELEQFSSIKLFLQSARRARPGFEAAADEQQCAGQICRLVEGVPLGIELAAGWLRSLSCEQIVREIENNLDFLESPLRDTPERHRSMRAVFDYSWALLDEQERCFLASLAVFQGAFQREACEAVTETGGKRTALNLLTALVNKSLVQMNMSGTYALHSLMREYALEALERRAEAAEAAQKRHAQYFLQLLAGQESALQGKEQPQAQQRIAACLGDIRSAWLFALGREERTLADAALESLHLFFNTRNRDEDALRLYAEGRSVLGQAPSETVERETLRLENREAAALISLNRLEQARPSLGANLETARRLEMPAEEALALVNLGNVAWLDGDNTRATMLDLEALEIHRRLGMQRGMAGCLDRIGVSAWAMGNFQDAGHFMQQALEILEKDGDPAMMVRVLDHMGVVQRDQGELDAARQYFEKARKALELLDSPFADTFLLNHLAGVEYLAGREAEAIPIFEKSIALGRELGDRRALAYNLLDLGEVLKEKDTDEGKTMIDESLAIFEALGDRFGVILARNLRATLAFQDGNVSEGKQMLKRSLEEAMEMENSRLISDTLLEQARVFSKQGHATEAVEIVGFLQKTARENRIILENCAALLAELRQYLGEEAVQQALVAGDRLTLDEVRARS